jgi:PAS domain S-box-containing protein
VAPLDAHAGAAHLETQASGSVPSRGGTKPLSDTDDQPADPAGLDEHEALRALVEGTASHTGERFFAELVRNLARVLDTHGAWVTEYLEETNRLRALSFWRDDQWVKDYEYEVVGTPCEPVLEQGCLVHFADRLIKLFPDDPDLEPFGAVSYMGAPFLDYDGRLLGHLAVMDTKPMPDSPRTRALFQVFANRAAAELRRMRLDAELREREQELGRLVDSAMDAIVELDPDLRVTLVNNAGEKLFGCAAEQMIGEEFSRFLSDAGLTKLCELIDELERLPEGRRYLWIPGGFGARPVAGEEFPAEATLSRFEVRGGLRYTLILRNVNERLEAERTIRSLTVEAQILREELRELHDVDDVIGESRPVMELLREVRQVAGTDSTVLILGETGTGKELIARAIHAASTRKRRPLIKVNCGAIPATLIESEFFGHERGAFTGATTRREGRFALADRGTIFLDEVGELPLDLQTKLLRVLQEGEFEPVGSSKSRKVDVRVIAATNRELERAVREGKFRDRASVRGEVRAADGTDARAAGRPLCPSADGLSVARQRARAAERAGARRDHRAGRAARSGPRATGYARCGRRRPRAGRVRTRARGGRPGREGRGADPHRERAARPREPQHDPRVEGLRLARLRRPRSRPAARYEALHPHLAHEGAGHRAAVRARAKGLGSGRWRVEPALTPPRSV